MSRIVNLFLVLVFITSLLYSGEAYARRRGTILDFFEDKYVIKAYVSDMVNSCGDDKIDVKDLKSGIEKALDSRRSHTFKIVSEETEADIIINTEIVEYLWTEEDPVDMIMGIATVVDAAVQDNYARMQIVFTVIDAKDGAQLWREKLQSTITNATMTEEESYSMSNENIVKVFIRKLFAKPRRR